MKGGESIFIDKKSPVGVLILHGFTSTPYRFKELAIFLSNKGFSVSVPLIAGHGTTPDDLMKTSPADWTDSVMAAYLKLKQISGRIIVIGGSFGSNLAFWLGQETGDELSGIISISAPIFLRFRRLIMLRYWTYGRFKKYYRKPPWANRTGLTDKMDEVVYSVIPIKSLKEFLDFISKDTISHLPNIKAPVLIIQSTADLLLRHQSANYIFNNISSAVKELYWFKVCGHNLLSDNTKEELFAKIVDFINKIT